MSQLVQVNDSTATLRFMLVLTSDHITGATGKTPTVTILKAGATAFTSPAGSIRELGSGWYEVYGSASDVDTLGPLALHATASACDPGDYEYTVVQSIAAAAAALSPSSATTTSVTAQALIRRALRSLGVLQEGEEPSAEQAETGLEALNEMLDAWNTESLLLPNFQRDTYTLVAGQSSYAIGPTGDFVTSRPMDIEDAAIIPVGQTYEIPVGLMTKAGYASIVIKSLTMTWPTSLRYEPTQPNGTILVYPVPTTAATLVLYTMETVRQFADLVTAYDFQPGYVAAIRWNLAWDLSPEYDVPQTKLGQIQSKARETKGAIKRQNEDIAYLPLAPSGLTGRGKNPSWTAIYTGVE